MHRGEINVAELKVYTDLSAIPGAIDFNFEEIEKELEKRLKLYNNLVVTPESIKRAKKDRASLNLLKQELEGMRKQVKAECLKPYTDFETKCKSLVSMIDEPIQKIDGQLQAYKETELQAKHDVLEAYFNSIIGDMYEMISFDKVLNPKWRNVSETQKKLQEEIAESVNAIRENVQSLRQMYGDSPNLSAIIARYCEHCDYITAMAYASELEAEAKKQERQQEMQREEQREIVEAAKAYAEPEPDAMAQIRQEYAELEEKRGRASFYVVVTRTQLLGLVDYMKKSGIEYHAYKKPQT
jgi:Protein of unknown function (DUF1351)